MREEESIPLLQEKGRAFALDVAPQSLSTQKTPSPLLSLLPTDLVGPVTQFLDQSSDTINVLGFLAGEHEEYLAKLSDTKNADGTQRIALYPGSKKLINEVNEVMRQTQAFLDQYPQVLDKDITVRFHRKWSSILIFSSIITFSFNRTVIFPRLRIPDLDSNNKLIPSNIIQPGSYNALRTTFNEFIDIFTNDEKEKAAAENIPFLLCLLGRSIFHFLMVPLYSMIVFMSTPIGLLGLSSILLSLLFKMPPSVNLCNLVQLGSANPCGIGQDRSHTNFSNPKEKTCSDLALPNATLCQEYANQVCGFFRSQDIWQPPAAWSEGFFVTCSDSGKFLLLLGAVFSSFGFLALTSFLFYQWHKTPTDYVVPGNFHKSYPDIGRFFKSTEPPELQTNSRSREVLDVTP